MLAGRFSSCLEKQTTGEFTEMVAADESEMLPNLTSMFLPVRAGRCRLWVGQHRAASSSDALPLLVCHGGPGVPSDYLFPLSGQLPRPVLFFDQLGCGRSERPSPEVEEYSIAASVQDLVEVVEAMVAKRLIPLQRGEPAYHLYGQSFGGILAFEALAPNSGLPLPRSLTLSNVPSSVPVLLEEVAALLAHLDGDGARFDVTHVCRTTPRPPELLATYAPGHPGNHWRGPSTRLSSDTRWRVGNIWPRDGWRSSPERPITRCWRDPRSTEPAWSASCRSTKALEVQWPVWIDGQGLIWREIPSTPST